MNIFRKMSYMTALAIVICSHFVTAGMFEIITAFASDEDVQQAVAQGVATGVAGATTYVVLMEGGKCLLVKASEIAEKTPAKKQIGEALASGLVAGTMTGRQYGFKAGALTAIGAAGTNGVLNLADNKIAQSTVGKTMEQYVPAWIGADNVRQVLYFGVTTLGASAVANYANKR